MAPGPARGDSTVSPTIRNFQRARAREQRGEQVLSDAITRFSGSMVFVGVHLVWFTAWIVWNEVTRGSFDPFPFGLLTLVVSLEAIFLSTFVMISQNRQAARSDESARQDFETNVYSEALSELIGERLGISEQQVRDRYHQLMAEARLGVSHAEGPGT